MDASLLSIAATSNELSSMSKSRENGASTVVGHFTSPTPQNAVSSAGRASIVDLTSPEPTALIDKTNDEYEQFLKEQQLKVEAEEVRQRVEHQQCLIY